MTVSEYILHDAVELQLGDLGTLEGVRLEGVTDGVLLSTLLESLDELVVDTLLDVDTRTGAAGLSVVEVDTEVDPRDGVVNISIVKDDVGALATKLEGNLLQVGIGSSLHDLASDHGGTGESDLVNVHVRSNGGTGDLSDTRDDVDDTWGETSLLDQVGGNKSGQRSLLSGLENDSVSGSDGRANLPRPHEKGEI